MYERTRQIRDFINNPRIKHGLVKNQTLWLQLCSSLDVIEDTHEAIEAFPAGPGTTIGSRYLSLYGLLQAFYVQQDAVDALCESLGVATRTKDYPELRDIRETRNESTGHPTKRGKSLTSHYFIVRVSLEETGDGFELHQALSDGKYEFKRISTKALIAAQRSNVSKILAGVVEEVTKRDAAYRDRFKMEKLAEGFAQTLDYFIGKVIEGTRENGSDTDASARVGLAEVKRSVQAFKDSIEKRGLSLSTYPSVKYLCEELEYPIAELERFFDVAPTIGESEAPTCINEKTAYIFAFFAHAKLKELRDVAQAIDAEFEG